VWDKKRYNKYMKNGLVKKSNELIESIEAHWRLNLIQSKIVAYLTSKTHKDDEDLKKYIFPVATLLEDLGLHSKAHEKLVSATRGIIKKGYIEIKTNKGLLQTNIMKAYYDEKEKTVSLSFDPDLKPYFLQLKKAFTKYELVNVLKLRSKYAIRIYEYCIMIRGAKRPSCTINITIAKLRKFLQMDKKTYPLYGRLKERVLSPARKQINENTDIFIDIKENKTGKKVTSLTVFVKPNPKKQEHVPLPYKEKKLFTAPEDQALFQEIKAPETREEEIKKNIIYAENEMEILSKSGKMKEKLYSDFSKKLKDLKAELVELRKQ
jgi:plasmid replication initiation protein